MSKIREIVPYDHEYYTKLNCDSAASAKVLVPYFMDALQPGSVLDVGCGQGAWLAEWLACGGVEVMGLDGTWVDRSQLLIPEACFRSVDLTGDWELSREYDVATCLEVAEHLPASAADALVAQLVRAAPIVLFSAAIPYQVGTDHINCQWPAYWAERFSRHSYSVLDPVRLKFWNREVIASPYRQNLLVYLHPEAKTRCSPEWLATEVATPISLVHPDIYMRAAGVLSAQEALRETFGYNLACTLKVLKEKLKGKE